jgi:hypothetical protein
MCMASLEGLGDWERPLSHILRSPLMATALCIAVSNAYHRRHKRNTASPACILAGFPAIAALARAMYHSCNLL